MPAKTQLPRSPPPFFVPSPRKKTPIEQGGHLSVPEAQLDRFHVPHQCRLPPVRRRNCKSARSTTGGAAADPRQDPPRQRTCCVSRKSSAVCRLPRPHPTKQRGSRLVPQYWPSCSATNRPELDQGSVVMWGPGPARPCSYWSSAPKARGRFLKRQLI